MPYAQIDRASIYYERHGSGPALVLIHGLGSSTRDWSPQIEAFARDRSVLVMDLRGHGRSAQPGTPKVLPICLFATDVAALMAHEGIDQADVIGLSLGGAVAFQLVVDHPEKVRSLTIVNSSPHFDPANWRQRWMLWQRILILRLLGMQTMARVLAPKLFPDDPSLQQLFRERFRENDKRSYLAALRGLIGWSVQHRLGEIACPVLVVGADQDYSPVADKQAYVVQIPEARLVVIPNAHHAVTMERAGAFNHEVASFLAALPAGG